MTLGRSIRLYMVDGTPSGLVTAEIMNWTGHVLSGPRTKLAELMQRPECTRTCVYLLVGPDPANSLRSRVYIGESDDVVRHLEQHSRPEEQGGHDFWERICLVTSKELSLTRAHVKNLQRQLIGLARHANRCELVNSPELDYEPLSEADCSDMMFFLEHIYAVLPALRYDFLTPIAEISAPSDAESDGANESPLFKLEVQDHKLLARARVFNGRFVVLKGSQALRFVGEAAGDIQQLHSQLIEDGVLLPDGEHLLRFSKDHAFSNHRTAALLICGQHVDGGAVWCVSETGEAYAAWLKQQLIDSGRASFSSHEEWLKQVYQ